MKKSNAEIKGIMKDTNIYSWEVAKAIGIHEGTFSRWFREPLTEEQQKQILMAIESIKLSRMKEKQTSSTT